jgi:hypothetical protein
MAMDSNVVKFPFSVSRKVHARKPRAAATVTKMSATPAEQLDPWYQAGTLLRKLNDRNLLPAGVECMRLLLERHGTAS